MNKCKTCGREYFYDRKKGHTKTKCNSCMANNRRMKLKKKCVEYKGGKCIRCGYHKCLDALTFHHVEQKTFAISGNHCRKWEVVKVELDKCILLCANCHAEEHSRGR